MFALVITGIAPGECGVYVCVAFLLMFILAAALKNKIFMTAFLTAFVAAGVYNVHFQRDIKPVQSINESDAIVSGVICDLPAKKQGKYLYTIKIDKINNSAVKPFKVMIFSPKALEGDVYDEFNGLIHMSPPNTPLYFNFFSYYRSRGIYATAYLLEHEDYTIKPASSVPLNYYILNFRSKILSSQKSIFEPRIASVINGVLLGEKNDIPHDIKSDFDTIGAYHLLTTAGIQVSIISCCCVWLLKKLRFKLRTCYILSGIAVATFMALAGFTPAVMRAGFMMIIYFLGQAFFKKPDSLNSLGAAALAVCLINPDFALGISLWMSVFSMLGITVIYPEIYKNIRLSKKLRFKKTSAYICSGIIMSFSVTLSTIPLAACYFKKTSIIASLSNLILIPQAEPLIIISLVTSFLNIIKVPAFIITPFAFLCGILAKSMIFCASILSKIPFALISTDYGFVDLCIACGLILLAVSVYGSKPRRNIILAVLLTINLLLAGALSYQIMNKDKTQIKVIDCHEGPQIIVSKNNHRAIILCLKEKCSTTVLDSALSQSYAQNTDYLFMPFVNINHEEFAQSVIDNYKPAQTIICAKDAINIDYSNTSPVYFDKNLTSTLWDNLKIDTIESNGYIYMYIICDKTKLLVIPSGGNANDIPPDLRACDILILGALPMDYSLINTQKIILCTNPSDTNIVIPKLSQPVISVARTSTTYINITPHKKYNIKKRR